MRLNPHLEAARQMHLTAKANRSDKGLGDTVARILAPIGGNAYKAWYRKTFGKPCGCEGRQRILNRLVPYQ